MTTDLWMLVGASALQFVLILAAATPRLAISGARWGLGNRDEEGAEVPKWAERFQRSSDNLAENLPLFAILVLVANVSGEADATSALGAEVFLGARVAHALIYGAGIPYVRTLVWSVSIGGIAMVAWTLF